MSNANLKSRAKDAALTAAKQAASLAGAALNRADILGGEIRDRITGELERRPEVKAKLDAALARFRKVDPVQERLDKIESERRERAARMAAETNAAPPPTAAELKERAARAGLGDPEIGAQIFGRSSCPWSGRAIKLLEDRKADFDFIDLDDPDNGDVETKLIAETKYEKVPWVYLRGEFIGGYNELSEVDRLGQLEARLKGEAAAGPGPKIEIAGR